MKSICINKIIIFFFITLLCGFEYVVVLAQPANDDPCNAITLTVGSSCTFSQYTNASATASAGVPAPGCASYSGGDVWFKVTVPAGGALNFDSNTGVITDGGMAIYSGTCGSLTLIQCDDDASANGLMPAITRTGLTVGSTIWIRFWEFGNNNNGTFNICVFTPPAGPSNQYCADAINLCGTQTVSGTTVNALNQPSIDPPIALWPCNGVADNYVWYKFTSTAAGGAVTINVTTPGCNANDLQVAVFKSPTTPCQSSADWVAPVSCVQNSVPFTITTPALTPNTVYYIVIDNWPGNFCNFTFTISGAASCVACPNITTVVTATPSTICSGSSSSLSATPSGGTAPYTYSWTPSTGLSSTTVATPTATPPVTTIYQVIVTDANGCKDTAGVTVTVNTLSVLVNASTTSLCQGQSSNLTATASGGTPGYVYSWSPAAGLSSTTIFNPVATPATNTTYTATVTDAAGCSKVGSVSITVTTTPTSTFTVSPLPVCIGDTVTITYTGNGLASDIYIWNFNGGTVVSGSGQGPYTVYWTTGVPATYNVSLSVTKP